MKKKICVIKDCFDCSHCAYSSESPTWDGFCLITDKEIEDVTTEFPEWCPLDDVE